MDAEQYQKLALAVMAAIPMDLDSQIADGWIRDPLGLTVAMRQALAPGKQDQEWKPHLFEKLDRRIVDLPGLTGRARNSLLGENRDKEHRITYVGQLVQMRKVKLSCLWNFGNHSLKNVTQVLAELGLELDMDVQGWVPPEQRNL